MANCFTCALNVRSCRPGEDRWRDLPYRRHEAVAGPVYCATFAAAAPVC